MSRFGAGSAGLSVRLSVAENDDNDGRASWPVFESLAESQYVDSPHPSLLPKANLLAACELSSHRRGGPGGQHRNKVNSAIMVRHVPTGISAEANERRDQSQNRRIAIDRLRLRLAFLLRTCPSNDAPSDLELALRQKFYGKPLKISDTNDDHAGVLALLLDDLRLAGGQPSLVAEKWAVTSSSLVRLIASEPAAFQILNRWRTHHGRSALHP